MSATLLVLLTAILMPSVMIFGNAEDDTGESGDANTEAGDASADIVSMDLLESEGADGEIGVPSEASGESSSTGSSENVDQQQEDNIGANLYDPSRYSQEIVDDDRPVVVDDTSLSEGRAYFVNGGDDTITSTTASDYVEGGVGSDLIVLQGGNDIALGGTGNDSIHGGLGSDSIFGGEGDDTIDGQKGSDILYGNEGNDTIIGHNFADRIYGGDGNDVLYSDLDTFEKTTFDAADTLFGGTGNDTLNMANGDHATGGEGADQFTVNVSDPTSGIASITDFDPAEDTLVIAYDPQNHPATPIITTQATTNETLILLDGNTVARLAGNVPISAGDVFLASV